MATLQELVDRLVTAVEEQDVLFTLVWAYRLEVAGGTLDGKHSWKGYTPLEAIARVPVGDLSSLHKFIAHLLVLKGIDTEDEMPITAGVRDRLAILRASGNEMAENARFLLSLPLDEASDWIDSHLPLAPNCDQLTGEGPLPPPPPPSSVPSTVSLPETRVDLVPPSLVPVPEGKPTPLAASADENDIIPPLHSRDSTATSTSLFSPPSYSSPSFDSCPNFVVPARTEQDSPHLELVTLHLAGLPDGISTREIFDIFHEISAGTQRVVGRDPRAQDHLHSEHHGPPNQNATFEYPCGPPVPSSPTAHSAA
ncbi:hypothetical protein JCM11491_005284 [Sporobolomyces phaffii]